MNAGREVTAPAPSTNGLTMPGFNLEFRMKGANALMANTCRRRRCAHHQNGYVEREWVWGFPDCDDPPPLRCARAQATQAHKIQVRGSAQCGNVD